MPFPESPSSRFLSGWEGWRPGIPGRFHSARAVSLVRCGGGGGVRRQQTTPGVFLVDGLLRLSSVLGTEWLGPQQLG